MILDKIHPDDLFPTEAVQCSVLGKMAYPIHGEVKIFEAAYVATNERLILNVDMAGEFYYRNISYDEVKAVTLSTAALDLAFDIGTFTLKEFDYSKAQQFAQYIKQH